MLSKKSPRRSCRIEIRNNRIMRADVLNQSCVSEHDLESILLGRGRKIFFRQHRPIPEVERPNLLWRTTASFDVVECRPEAWEHMRRREFITLLGGAAAWPLVASAQQADRVRRIGVILPAVSDDLKFQTWVGSFLQALQQSGWTIGRNVQVETRWATANTAAIRKHAAELAASAPDVILAHGSMTVGPLLEATRTV